MKTPNDLYSYQLPPSLLAHKPASPRDSAKLFVYNTATDEISFDRFSNLHTYLPKKSFLVLNNTRVIPARLPVTKDTGGNAELLLLPDDRWGTSPVVRAMSNRKLTVGQSVHISKKLSLTIEGQDKNIFTLRAQFEPKQWNPILTRYGITPVPPYLLPTPMPEATTRLKYQTVFAKEAASVAAPTASLHFTERLLNKLKTQGIGRVDVTLHVGMGTFAPVTEEHIQAKKLHQEYGEITRKAAQKITNLKQKGASLVAVGTTATRLLEANSNKGIVTTTNSPTDIFILPPHNFQVVDALVTNFHLSGSSLMMLVEAFLQHKGAQRHLKELYNIAIDKKFRFYSFGDAMLIL